MSEDKAPGTTSDHYEVVKPADFSLPSASSDSPAAAETTSTRIRTPLILLGLFVLLALVIILPTQLDRTKETASSPTIDGASSKATPTASSSTSTGTATPAVPISESPYAQAERAKQRQRAQDILEPLLASQEQLRTVNVERWAGVEFSKLREKAAAGDLSYQQQQFDTAIEQYSAALKTAEDLLAEAQSLPARLNKVAESALAEGNGAAAVKTYHLIELIEPDNPIIESGLNRVALLQQTWPLIQQARELQSGGELEQALDRYRQVKTIDSASTEATQQITAIEGQLKETRFTRLMSRGLAAIDRGAGAEAERILQQAAELKPKDSGVQSALRQARQLSTGKRVRASLGQIDTLEAQEKWGQVVSAIDELSTQEGNLAGLSDRRESALRLQTLHTQLDKALKAPEALSDERKYNAAKKLVTEANGFISQSPSLGIKTQELDELLQLSRIPVAVVIVSDNQTEVNVFRVARLGRIAEKSLQLTPGKYVITGSRNGYRDVRLEVIISPEDAGRRITVQTTEPI